MEGKQCSLCQKCNILGWSVSQQLFGDILSSLGATAVVAERSFVPSCHGRAPKTRILSPHSNSAVHHRGSRQDLSCWARHFTGTDRLTHHTFPPVSAPQPMAGPNMTCPAFRMTFLCPQSTLLAWPWVRQQCRGGGLVLSHGFKDLFSNNFLQLTQLRASEEKGSHSSLHPTWHLT